MQSALVTIPAMIEVILSPGLVPIDVAIRTHRASNPTSPQTWASRITRTRPARDTRFGSPKLACVRAALSPDYELAVVRMVIRSGHGVERTR